MIEKCEKFFHLIAIASGPRIMYEPFFTTLELCRQNHNFLLGEICVSILARKRVPSRGLTFFCQKWSIQSGMRKSVAHNLVRKWKLRNLSILLRSLLVVPSSRHVFTTQISIFLREKFYVGTTDEFSRSWC